MMLECQWFYQLKAYPHSVTWTVGSFVDPLVVAWLVCGCFRGFHSDILFRDLATLGRVSNCTSHLQWFGHTAKRKLCCVAIQQGRCWIVLVSYVCHFFTCAHICVILWAYFTVLFCWAFHSNARKGEAFSCHEFISDLQVSNMLLVLAKMYLGIGVVKHWYAVYQHIWIVPLCVCVCALNFGHDIDFLKEVLLFYM